MKILRSWVVERQNDNGIDLVRWGCIEKHLERSISSGARMTLDGRISLPDHCQGAGPTNVKSRIGSNCQQQISAMLLKMRDI